jgi:hypothetical protein
MRQHTTSLLIGLSAFLLLGFSSLLYLDHRMAQAFASIHPDQPLAELLVRVGKPHLQSDCDSAARPIRRKNAEVSPIRRHGKQALAQLQGGEARYCQMILTYRSYLPGDGWTVAIDEQDVIMQIDRRALP